MARTKKEIEEQASATEPETTGTESNPIPQTDPETPHGEVANAGMTDLELAAANTLDPDAPQTDPESGEDTGGQLEDRENQVSQDGHHRYPHSQLFIAFFVHKCYLLKWKDSSYGTSPDLSVYTPRYKKRHLRNIRTVPQMSNRHLLPRERPGPTNPDHQGFIACSVCTVVARKGMVAVQRDIFVISYSPSPVKVPNRFFTKNKIIRQTERLSQYPDFPISDRFPPCSDCSPCRSGCRF